MVGYVGVQRLHHHTHELLLIRVGSCDSQGSRACRERAREPLRGTRVSMGAVISQTLGHLVGLLLDQSVGLLVVMAPALGHR